ncbi:MAG: M48 family metalloprotease [Coleofasciculaceae cyanobacterium RL_1_1]|nr:M48 family metalloprotease [Coleofasciculaceae cyanobacterium RL_1_1]
MQILNTLQTTRPRATRYRSRRLATIATALALGLNLPWLLTLHGAIAADPHELRASHIQLHDLTPNKSISLKTSLPPDVVLEPLPEVQSSPDIKDDPARSQKGVEARDRTIRVTERQILQERGRLERGDRTLDSDGSYYDTYPLNGSSGQQLRIELTSTEFDTYLILLDPSGQPVGENDDRSQSDSNSVLSVRLERSGEYTIVVNSYDNRGRGSYALTVVDLGANGDTSNNPPANTSTTRQPRAMSLTGDLATLAEADRLYLQGQVSAAETIYRRVKPSFLIGTNPVLLEERTDETQLSPEARTIWDETRSAIDRNRESQVEGLWPKLIDAAPGFVDGQLITAEYLIDENEEELVISQLEELALRFPDDAEIARLHVKALREDRQRLEASIAARQFAIANPDHPAATEFTSLADDYMGDFRRVLRERIALQGLGSVAIGVLTGRTSTAVFDGLQLVQLMAMGESGIGDFVSNQVKQQSKIIIDPEAVAYINDLGQQVAQRMGRDEFEYEFYIIEDDSLNAFALPGGKVFIHTGALAAAKTEAELIGLLGHEVGHAVLSHGFKRIVRGQLIASLAREIPLGSILYNLVGLDYSREHERQSDIIGTRVLANAGYAADGLRNFMATLGAANPQRVPQYLSTHPAPDSRVQYLEELVVRNGYNRYSFEGVENLARIQARLGLPERPAKD